MVIVKIFLPLSSMSIIFIVVDDVLIGDGVEIDDGVGVGGVGGDDGVSICGICGGFVIGTTGEGCGGPMGFPGSGELTLTATGTIHLCIYLFT